MAAIIALQLLALWESKRERGHRLGAVGIYYKEAASECISRYGQTELRYSHPTIWAMVWRLEIEREREREKGLPRKDREKKRSTWRVFSLKELHLATNNFNYDNKLGKGGFGSVYWGQLRDGSQVDYACTPEEVQQHFQSCHTVNRVTILIDKFGQPKGFAYVEFLEQEAIQEALSLNETELHGRQLKMKRRHQDQMTSLWKASGKTPPVAPEYDG